MNVVFSVYFPVFVMTALFSIVSISKEGKKYTSLYLFFSFIAFLLMAGLRESSPDQMSYALVFEQTRSLFDLVEYGFNYEALGFQWGFLSLLSVIKSITNNETVMFFMLAFINIWLVVYSCKEISPYPMLSVFIYYSWFYYSNLGALRHAMLSGMVMLTLVFVVNNKTLKALFFYLYSIAVHKTGVFVLSIYLVSKLKLQAKGYYVLLFFMISVALFGGAAYFMIELLYPFLPESWREKIYLHVALGRFSGQEDLIRGTVFKQLSILLVCLVYFSPLKKRFSRKFSIIFGTYFFSTAWLLLFLDFKIIGDRVSSLLSISEVLLIPMLLSIVSLQERIYVLALIIGVMFFQVTRLYGEQFYLYKSIL